MKRFIPLLLLFAACSKENNGSSPDCSTPKTFSAHASPVIQATCAISSCHNTGSTSGPGPLTSYAEIFASRSAIRAAVAAGTMPRSGSLTTDQRNAILCWIDGGAPNN